MELALVRNKIGGEAARGSAIEHKPKMLGPVSGVTCSSRNVVAAITQ
jgi:hypothetical protein